MSRCVQIATIIVFIATVCLGQTTPTISRVNALKSLRLEVEQTLLGFRADLDRLRQTLLHSTVQRNIEQQAFQTQLSAQAARLDNTSAELTTVLGAVGNGNATGTPQSVVTLTQELDTFKQEEMGHILDAMQEIQHLRNEITAVKTRLDYGNVTMAAMNTRIDSVSTRPQINVSSGELNALKSQFQQNKGEVEQILGQHELSIREIRCQEALTKVHIAANCNCNSSGSINNGSPISPVSGTIASANLMFSDMNMKMADAARALETVNEQITNVKTSASENGEIIVRLFGKVNRLESKLISSTAKNDATVGALKKALLLLQRMTVHWISANRQNITGIDQQLTELVTNVTALQHRLN